MQAAKVRMLTSNVATLHTYSGVNLQGQKLWGFYPSTRTKILTRPRSGGIAAVSLETRFRTQPLHLAVRNGTFTKELWILCSERQLAAADGGALPAFYWLAAACGKVPW